MYLADSLREVLGQVPDRPVGVVAAGQEALDVNLPLAWRESRCASMRAGSEYRCFMAVPLSGEVESDRSVSSSSADRPLFHHLSNFDSVLKISGTATPTSRGSCRQPIPRLLSSRGGALVTDNGSPIRIKHRQTLAQKTADQPFIYLSTKGQVAIRG